MSVVHDLLNHVEEKKIIEASPWAAGNRPAKRGLFVFDLPNEILNDFYDLKEYVRIANLRGQMRVLSMASSVAGEGSSTIATYLAFLMSGGVAQKLEKPADTPRPEEIHDEEEKRKPDADKIFTTEFTTLSKKKANESPSEEAQDKKEQKAEPSDILLVDANFHQPGLHRFFGLEAEDGLAEIIEGELDWKQFAKPVHDSNLQIITAGSPDRNPAELLSSETFLNLVNEWRDHFRYVIFDSPPVLSYVDALSLATVVDGVVLVVWAGHTRWEVAQNAKRKLSTAHSNLLGVALNRRRMDIPDGLYKRLMDE
ncbi:MAG: CpsD/CapB family tyrosine-protein kinase [Calditrichaeota bacterium]|nr:CpsD/CapB family tyrosine-protein kinase [Calditrichota bacterium]